MRMPNDAPVNNDTNAAPPLTYNYVMQAKRHAEMLDALHTIGRNIAQQNTHRRMSGSAIDRISAVLTMAFFLACVVFTIWMNRGCQ